MTLTQSHPSPFGTLLRDFRKRRQVSQQQLAAAIGVHRNAISRWEQGDFLPEHKTMVLEIARYLRLDDQEARQLLEASFTALSPPWSVPLPRNPFFTGREEILEELHTRLSAAQVITLNQSYALHGLGGVGKTQIALEYAYQHPLEYSAIFWIGAETLENVMSSMLQISEVLRLPEREEANQQRVFAAVQHWLTTRRGWLLIWDNLEDPALLRSWLPLVRQGAMLVTTRRQALGTLAQGLELPPMRLEEWALFVLRRARLLQPEATHQQVRQLAARMPAEYAAVEALGKEMDGLPLALDQIGAYVEETGCSLADYLQRYMQQREFLLARRGGTGGDHPHSVTTTFLLASAQVERQQQAAADLLRVCAFLHAETIPEELFTQGAAHLGPLLEPMATDPSQFDQAIAVLLSLSLVQRHSQTHTISLHRLVQAVLREQMSEHERTGWLRRLVAALDALLTDISGEVTHEAWRQCERLLPHALAIAAAFPKQAEDQVLAEVVRKVAKYLHERALYEQAEPLLERALRIYEQQSEPQHEQIANILDDLGTFYRDQGKHEQAEPFYLRALRIWEQYAEPEHPRRAIMLNNLALVYYDQGKYEQAEPLYLQALRIHEQQLGPEHIEVAIALNNLALLYRQQGKYEQAEAFYLRVLAICEQRLDPGHPNLAYPLANLANLYQDQGRYEQAEPFYQQALGIREKQLGPEHPDTAVVLSYLALLYSKQKRYTQAEPLFERALQICTQAWGPEHAQLALPLDGLANLYVEQGKYEQAGPLFERALRIREQHLGQHHPETAQILHDLAVLCQRQGDASRAISYAERALSIRFSSLGKTHPKTGITRAFYTQLVEEQVL